MEGNKRYRLKLATYMEVDMTPRIAIFVRGGVVQEVASDTAGVLVKLLDLQRPASPASGRISCMDMPNETSRGLRKGGVPLEAKITWITLYRYDHYVSYNDSDIPSRYFHGYHLHEKATIDRLRRDGADEVSVIVVIDDPTIPVLPRVQKLCQAGYTYEPTPIEGPMTYRLRRIKEQPS